MKAKVFRFEAMNQGRAEGAKGGANTPVNGDQMQFIIDELASLREQMNGQTEALGPLNVGSVEGGFSAEIGEALKLKRELDTIYLAIAETKKQIASLSTIGFESESGRPVDELDAVVKGTEGATNQILTAVEAIENGANTLADTLTGDAGVIASNMQDSLVEIYEACNFQDITGQRITKVVNALRFISERIESMIDIWGGMESFKDVEAESHNKREGDAALLNGPALEEEEGTASQDDIDALFA